MGIARALSSDLAFGVNVAEAVAKTCCGLGDGGR